MHVLDLLSKSSLHLTCLELHWKILKWYFLCFVTSIVLLNFPKVFVQYISFIKMSTKHRKQKNLLNFFQEFFSKNFFLWISRSKLLFSSLKWVQRTKDRKQKYSLNVFSFQEIHFTSYAKLVDVTSTKMNWNCQGKFSNNPFVTWINGITADLEHYEVR